MKYFTLNWWAGEVEDMQAAIGDYRRYLDSVLVSLPAELQCFSRDVSLHDAQLRRLYYADHTIELQLDGFRFDKESCAYFDRQFRLTYRRVRSLTSTSNPEAGLPGPKGYGDLGYDELEIIQDGLYEHRILFSSGIELQVRFAEFSLWYEDKVM